MAASLLLTLPATAAAEDARPTSRDIVVFVSREWPELRSISLAEFRQIYLGRRRSLAGRSVECIDLPFGDPVRIALGRALLRMSEKETRDYWIEQALTGGALPPREVATSDAALEAVAARPGRLGYLDEATWSSQSRGNLRRIPVRVGNALLHVGDGEYPLRMKPR